MKTPLKGVLEISTSELPITSVDLVLHRIEMTQELVKRQKSEVNRNNKCYLNFLSLQIMSIQVCEGDVLHGVDIPLQLLLPRYFTCPNIDNEIFTLDFQVSVNIAFSNGFLLTETLDLNLIR